VGLDSVATGTGVGEAEGFVTGDGVFATGGAGAVADVTGGATTTGADFDERNPTSRPDQNPKATSAIATTAASPAHTFQLCCVAAGIPIAPVLT